MSIDKPSAIADHGTSTRKMGRCSLVGAGPGDPELLTLKALKAIQSATVLLVDDLVSDAIVALAAPAARIIYVGKRGGCKSTPQAFVNKLTLAAVRDGQTVVRLKGGDPFVFGRGGEEFEHLSSVGICVDVINGISAGLAGPTSLGVALTHREHAHGVVFITGHGRPDGPVTDWKVLAAAAHSSRLTLVIYMGVSNASYLQGELLHGLPASTPVAVIQDVSLPSQRHASTTLDDLATMIDRERLSSPSIIVIGDVLRALTQLQQPAVLRA